MENSFLMRDNARSTLLSDNVYFIRVKIKNKKKTCRKIMRQGTHTHTPQQKANENLSVNEPRSQGNK